MLTLAEMLDRGIKVLYACGKQLVTWVKPPVTLDYNLLAQEALLSLYPQTGTANIAIHAPVDPTPALVMVSGTRKNFLQVSSYGSGVNLDTAARKPLYKIEHMAGTKNIINLDGEAAVIQRQKIKPFLSEPAFVDIAFKKSQAFFHELMQHWQNDVSFQDAMAYYCVNVIGDCVLGIPKVTLTEAQQVRQAGTLIGTADVNTPNFKDTEQQLDALNQTTVIDNQTHLLNTPNYTLEKAALTPADTAQQQLQKLLATHGASNLLVESNLSTLIMAGIYYVHQAPEIRQQLQRERDQAGELTREQLEKLPYLDCLYKETLRYISPTALITRETSHPVTLLIDDAEGHEKPYTLNHKALFFAPIRRLHHDTRIWQHPEIFDPSRFANHQMDAHLMPFSLGTRACPAASHFTPVVFKAALMASLAYDYHFDKPLEVIPVEAIASRWNTDYYADVQPARAASLNRGFAS